MNNMKSILTIALIFTHLITFSQEDESKDSLFNVTIMELNKALESNSTNNNNQQDNLIKENAQAWLIGDVEKLKEIIPQLLNEKEFKDEFSYIMFIDPQSFPSEKWDSIYATSKQVLEAFNVKSRVYKEILMFKVILEELTFRYDDKVESYSKLIELVDNKSELLPRMYELLGMAYQNINKSKKAIDTYNKGLYNNSFNVEQKEGVMFALLNVLTYSEDYKSIIKLNEKIKEYKNPYFNYFLAQAYENKKQLKKSNTLFDKFSKSIKSDNGFSYIESNNTFYNLRPKDFLVLGNHYSNRDKVKACHYYRIGLEQFNTPKYENIVTEKYLKSIKDKERVERIKVKKEEYENEQKEIKEQLYEKRCKF